MSSYLHRKYKEKEEKLKDKSDDDDSDLESIQSDEFEDMLDQMSGIIPKDDENLDFLNDVGDKLRSKGKKINNKGKF